MLERQRPRFVEVRRLANGSLGFYFRIPTYYRKLGCEIANDQPRALGQRVGASRDRSSPPERNRAHAAGLIRSEDGI